MTTFLLSGNKSELLLVLLPFRLRMMTTRLRPLSLPQPRKEAAAAGDRGQAGLHKHKTKMVFSFVLYHLNIFIHKNNRWTCPHIGHNHAEPCRLDRGFLVKCKTLLVK